MRAAERLSGRAVEREAEIEPSNSGHAERIAELFE